ncbi:MAG: type IV toxin-antitoxin system AbiEi family antitoxin domain-containing protein [Trebonia sp.]
MARPIPSTLRQLAKIQGGMVSRRQVIRSGMSEKSVDWLIAKGAWQRVHWGVYATFTGPLSRNAQLWAALLHGGPGARLSHETAAELLGLTDRLAPSIHLKIPAGRHIARAEGLVAHRSNRPDPGWRHPLGVPRHTLVEETIFDLVDAADYLDTAIGWVTMAFGRHLTSERSLRDEAAARKKLRWRKQIDDVITASAGGAHSVLEYRYDRDVARAHGLPAATRQFRFRKPSGTWGFRDRYHDQYKLAVELDGKQAHRADQRGADENRDNHATVLGGSTLRFGWDDVTRTPCATAATEAQALRERGWPGRLRPCSPSCRALAELPAAPGPRPPRPSS